MKVTIDENYNDKTLLKDWHPKVKKNFAALKNGLETGVINSSQIPDKGVTTAKIADYSVGTAQIAQGAINNTRILNGAVNARTIEDGCITGAKIADNTIDTNHIADGLITGNKISDTAVTGKHIADKSITGKNIADHTLDLDKFYSDIIPVIKNGFLAESDTKRSFDDVDNDGAWYRVLNPVSNVPDTTKNEEGWIHYACCNIRFDIDYRLQMAVNVASNKMFVRNKQPDAGWSTWTNVADIMSDGIITKSKLSQEILEWITALIDAVRVDNEVIDALRSEIALKADISDVGHPYNLTTQNKSSIVSAINEVNSKADSGSSPLSPYPWLDISGYIEYEDDNKCSTAVLKSSPNLSKFYMLYNSDTNHQIGSFSYDSKIWPVKDPQWVSTNSQWDTPQTIEPYKLCLIKFSLTTAEVTPVYTAIAPYSVATKHLDDQSVNSDKLNIDLYNTMLTMESRISALEQAAASRGKLDTTTLENFTLE